MKKSEIRPPRWASRFLEWYCRPALLEDLQGDLHECFQRNVTSRGPFRAKLIYSVDVIKFMRSYTVRKPKTSQSMNNLIVFQNYFKTSLRNISRNKLFSTINIAGLAVSMSVGLVLIVFLSELKSFDKFHHNYDRIYRVRNTFQTPQYGPDDYASTSVLAGKRIKESVSGIEAIAIIRNNFDKDVHAGDKTIPLKGIWANEDFFKVFTWDVLSGNTSSALTDLNSVVLTENSAVKLFGSADVLGKQVLVDTVNFTITAVIKDPPLNSHLKFDMVGSFITIDTWKLTTKDKNWMKWNSMWTTFIYLLLPEKHDVNIIEKSFAGISEAENKLAENEVINIHLQPFHQMVLGATMSNQIGPHFNPSLLWVLGGLSAVVIISACFNYTNLSIARALRRTKEVGIRKAAGASRRQVFNQFILESVVIAVLSLSLAFIMFLLIRPAFLSMDNAFARSISLQPTPAMYFYFVLMALLVGIFAGVLPAVFFSRINTAQVLKDLSTVKLFGNINLRKGLVVFQYVLSIVLIVSVTLAYRQYKYSLAFNLGLTTGNILNVDLQQNKAELVKKELAEIPEIKEMSTSMYVTGVGMTWSGEIRYKSTTDSIVLYYNYIDTAYLAVHNISLLAGDNFMPSPSITSKDAGILINQKTLIWMGLKNPQEAIGEEVFIDGEKNKIIGVVQDFHYNTLNNPVANFAFRYLAHDIPPAWGGVVNLNVQATDLPAFMNKLEAAWKKVDRVHPLKAEFYEEKIRYAYQQADRMVSIIGFLAFLSISIASLGLLGMVVFTTETRLKEISIRKVLGASEGNLVVLMSRGFLLLLVVACALAIPTAYLVFDRVVFSNIVFRAPIGFLDLFSGALVVLCIAVLAISSQTLRVARVNPANTLRTE